MTEHYRDSQVTLIQGDEVEVSGQLASWLIENGKAKAIRLSTLEAICKVLDCQPGDILEYEDSTENTINYPKRLPFSKT